MNLDRSDSPPASETKRRYASPTIVDVGGIDALTTGHGSPVGDDPHTGTTGYYNSAKCTPNAEVDLDDC